MTPRINISTTMVCFQTLCYVHLAINQLFIINHNNVGDAKRHKFKTGYELPVTLHVVLSPHTWMESCNLSIQQIGQLITYFMMFAPPHQTFIASEMQLSSATIVSWSHLLRKAELHWCINHTPQVLGGPGEIVEIDEAKFGRRKYNRGRKVDGQWVLGGFQRGEKYIFHEVVPDRSQATLMEVIHRPVLPETTIITDGWPSYHSISREGIFRLHIHSANINHTITHSRLETSRRQLLREFCGSVYRCQYPIRRTYMEKCKKYHSYFRSS